MRPKHANDYNGKAGIGNGMRDRPGRRESKWKYLNGCGVKRQTVAALKRERSRHERRMAKQIVME